MLINLLNKMNNNKNLIIFLLAVVLFLIFFDVGFPFEEPGIDYSDSSNKLVDIIPVGIPEVYGSELSLSYDDVSPLDPSGADRAINRMAELDMQIELEGENLERYVSILYEKEGGISCEYCCGARSIIFENGEPACGCAHSFAMRGIAKYLITEHGNEMSDEDILKEVGKWKVLFFPEIHQQKAYALEEEGLSADYITLTTNTYRGIEDGSQGGMVGGC